jgi:hypothetical protein
VGGTLQPSSLAGIKRLRLKQLTPKAGDSGGSPTSTTVKTLYIIGLSGKIDIRNVELDCGGDYTAGYIFNHNIYGGGIWVQDCNDVTIMGCEVFNGGSINGINVFGSDVNNPIKNVTIIDNYVHDLYWSAATVPADDVINGIWVHTAANVIYQGNRVRNLYGYATSAITGGNPQGKSPQRTRGHVFSLLRGYTASGNHVDTVDQGFDHTGTDGVRGFSFTANYARDCCSAGFKWANSQRHGSIVGNVAEDCGRFGYIFSPKADGGSNPDPGYMDVVGNRAINPGKPSIVDGLSYVAGYSAGFDVEDDHPENGQWPRSIRFTACTAYDYQNTPTMQYGFYCVINADHPETGSDATPWANTGYNFDGIELRDCKSVGHTIAAEGPAGSGNVTGGTHQPIVILTGSGGDSVADSTWVSVNYSTDPDPEDSLKTHDHASGENQLSSPIAGWAMIVASAHFVAIATGRRGLRVMVNGVEIAIGGRTWMNAPASDDCWLHVTCITKLVKGNAIRTEVYQSSGGALSLVDQKLTVFPIERKW